MVKLKKNFILTNIFNNQQKTSLHGVFFFDHQFPKRKKKKRRMDEQAAYANQIKKKDEN